MSDKYIIESERLTFEKIEDSHFLELKSMLADERVMYAWEHPFTEKEILDWIHRRKEGYRQYGYDYFLVREKRDGRVIGQIGILNESINGRRHTGLGWIIKNSEWNKGYATEGAKACVEYAFNILNIDELIADIRPTNFPSIEVAKKIGMKKIGRYNKLVHDKSMLHDIFILRKD